MSMSPFSDETPADVTQSGTAQPRGTSLEAASTEAVSTGVGQEAGPWASKSPFQRARRRIRQQIGSRFRYRFWQPVVDSLNRRYAVDEPHDIPPEPSADHAVPSSLEPLASPIRGGWGARVGSLLSSFASNLQRRAGNLGQRERAGTPRSTLRIPSLPPNVHEWASLSGRSLRIVAGRLARGTFPALRWFTVNLLAMGCSPKDRFPDAEPSVAPDFPRADPISPRRMQIVTVVLGLAWIVLVGRLVQLQGLDQQEFIKAADNQRTLIETIPPMPGDILDRRGRVLATSVKAYSLYLIPEEIAEPAEYAASLAAVLGQSETDLANRIEEKRDKQFLWVARRMSDGQTARVRSLKLPRGTWGLREEYRRIYPQGAVAAQVLGLRDIDGVGRGGIEEFSHDVLDGTPGKRSLIRDARGRVLEVDDDVTIPATAGKNVMLTLDVLLQHDVERSLDQLMAQWHPQTACALVLKPQTGEVLAMASRPTFDPNHPEPASPDAWKNRTIADIYEPGSTFKPFIVAYGLDRGLIGAEESFNCERGLYRMGRRLLHDHHRYGVMSLTDVLVKSSNIGMAKVGERLGNTGLFEAATLFGFGRRTGIELPGEQGGILRPLKQWNTYSTGSIPMGHEVAATPLQLLSACGALANGGLMIRPSILRTQPVDPADSSADSRSPGRLRQQLVQPEVAAWLCRGPMTQVVTRGTGKRARIKGFQVFGKTGTAQTLDESGGYRHGSYIASFLCGAPAKNPEVVVLVVVDQAGSGGEQFGGTVAAPAARDILGMALHSLGVQPSSDPIAEDDLADLHLPDHLATRTAAEPLPSPFDPRGDLPPIDDAVMDDLDDPIPFWTDLLANE